MQYTRILALGDSITFGARTGWGRTYPLALEELLSRHSVPSIVINAGVSGERSWEIIDRAWPHLGHDDWIRICICMMGTNDSKPLARTPIEWYLAQWERLRRMCVVTDTRLIAVEIPWIDATCQPEYDAGSIEWITTANGELRKWAESYSLAFINAYDAFRDRPELLADGVHPTNEGSLLIAERIYHILSAPLPAYEDRSFAPKGLVAMNGTYRDHMDEERVRQRVLGDLTS